MKKLLAICLTLLLSLSALSQENNLWLWGRVKESVGKFDLTDAVVLLYDSTGAVSDSIPANQGRTFRNRELVIESEFAINVPRRDSTYVFDVCCDGYKTETITYRVENIGKRERSRRIPTIYLERAPRMLKEVTVTTSKIKFYNKGDTIVYNADAFQLADGSMLDALISQLPGAELNDKGQIKVNGEFVESLLLNGKEFFDGNNNLMLENIAAYTVKSVEVYQGLKSEDKKMANVTATKVLTMDVKLKKEYNIGLMLNTQGGYGTEDRYMGRIFAAWFNATTRLSFLANANNLNDNRSPGKNDTWTPESMPSGTKEYRMAATEYNYENPENTRSAEGLVLFMQTLNKRRSTMARTNFLPGGDTYDNSFGNSRDRETEVRTRHSFFTMIDKVNLGISAQGNYLHAKNSASDISGAFSQEPAYISSEILDALYSDGSPELLETVINRARTRSDGWRRMLSGLASTTLSYSIPKTSDMLSLRLVASYDSNKEELWRDYDINYGDNPEAAIRRRRYTDNSPNHRMNLSGKLRYGARLPFGSFDLAYEYSFADVVKDSYTYALDRMENMGIYGVVPEGYLATLDPSNSYTSREIDNNHSISPRIMVWKAISDMDELQVSVAPSLSLTHRHFDYTRNRRDYRLSKTNMRVDVQSIWDGRVELYFNGKETEHGRKRYRNMIRYSYRIDTNLPEMVDMIDVTDDTDPLNIYTGNPDLKAEVVHRHLVRWSYTPHSHPTLNNILYGSFSHTSNALTRGFNYDTTTGVRHNMTYNVGGNRTVAFTNELRWQFGTKKQFTLWSETDINIARTSDMIGVNVDAPMLSKVHNRAFSEKLRLGWQFLNQSLQLRCNFTNRHTTSSREDFNNLDANHVNYGISGVFKLPAGFGISTDFMCYTRRGYGLAELDTTDPVWNMRVTYCPPILKSRLVFMLDGFDMLHRLSNVNYAVTASGRTVSYTNALPRYVMLSVQYSLNIQPKKK